MLTVAGHNSVVLLVLHRPSYGFHGCAWLLSVVAVVVEYDAAVVVVVDEEAAVAAEDDEYDG